MEVRIKPYKYTRYFQKISRVYQEKPGVRMGIELALTLLAISFFIIFAIRPTLESITARISEIRTQEEVREKLDKKIKNLQAARKTWINIKDKLYLLDQALPSTPSPEVFIQQIESAALLSGTPLSKISFNQMVLFGQQQSKQEQKTEKTLKLPDNIETISATISTEGRYNNTLNFIKILEELRRVNIITSLNISKEKEGTLKTNILVQVPYYKGGLKR